MATFLQRKLESCLEASRLLKAFPGKSDTRVFCSGNLDVDSPEVLAPLSRLFPSVKFSNLEEERVTWLNEPDEVYYLVHFEFKQ